MTGLTDLQSIADFETAARERLSTMSLAYYAGAAGDELTLGWNTSSFDRIRLRPRVLVDVSALDTSVELYGTRHPLPLLIAPTAYHRLAHPEGELATARGAGARGVTLVVSSLATTAIENIAAAATAPLWFQLYVQEDRGFTAELVARVEAAGCRALCLTVDTPVLGARHRELKAKFALPTGIERENLKGLSALAATTDHRPEEGGVFHRLFEPRLSWKDVDWLLSITKLPVLLKGILTGEDAARGVEAGAAGILVSNHGARNLDTVPATIDALPEVVEAVDGRVPVLLDGGIRRGTDIAKALARGARAVLIGRPALWGLAAGGAEGVARVIEILEGELRMAMALLGRRSLAEIDAGVLWERR